MRFLWKTIQVASKWTAASKSEDKQIVDMFCDAPALVTKQMDSNVMCIALGTRTTMLFMLIFVLTCFTRWMVQTTLLSHVGLDPVQHVLLSESSDKDRSDRSDCDNRVVKNVHLREVLNSVRNGSLMFNLDLATSLLLEETKHHGASERPGKPLRTKSTRTSTTGVIE